VRHRRRRYSESSSSSGSPVRRSKRRGHRHYSSGSSSSSDTGHYGRRRRGRRRKSRRHDVVYRIGDRVEVKDHGRRRRAKWVAAKVYNVQRSVYGEITYTVKLRDSGRKERFVPGNELRFRDSRQLEKRLLDDKIAHCMEDSRQINMKFARLQREQSIRGRRAFSASGGYPVQRVPRCQSVEGHGRLMRNHRQEQRSHSVPPACIDLGDRKTKEIYLNIILPSEDDRREVNKQEDE